MAPFKLRFSKMSKSRSSGSKGSRSNSVECEEPAQPQQPNSSSIHALVGSNSRPETPGTEGNNVVAVCNDCAGFPDSPPPSYQHVLEETRQKRSTTTATTRTEEEREENEEDENAAEERSDQRQTKPAETQRSSGGGGPGGGRTPAKGPEILHKSSKELYRAVAKQWGITCKMSDQCRCFDCQSHYFDCEYERDDQAKSDGGLGAGTPIYIAEVLHGTACAIL